MSLIAVRQSFTIMARRRRSATASVRSHRCPSSGALDGRGPGTALVVKCLGMIVAVVSPIVSPVVTSTDNYHAIPLGTFIDIANASDATG